MKKAKLPLTLTIAQIAVFSAVSVLLYLLLKFPLVGIFPAWLEIQISDMPALLAGFMMGPVEGAAVLVVRTLIKLPFTSTAMVGELADLLCGLAFVLPSAFIYKANRTKKGALISLAVGCACTVVMSIIANYFILLPFFIKAYGWSAIMGMFTVVFPDATQANFYTLYIFLSVIPFNLLRSLICALITFLVYKRLQRFFNFVFKRNRNKPENTDNVCVNSEQNEEITAGVVEEEQDGSEVKSDKSGIVDNTTKSEEE